MHKVCSWAFAKIRYIGPHFGQNQLHALNKYKTHPRSPIGQADVVCWFWLEKARVYLFFLLLSSFELIFTNFEPIREIKRTLLLFLSGCVCSPSVEIGLICINSVPTRCA